MFRTCLSGNGGLQGVRGFLFHGLILRLSAIGLAEVGMQMKNRFPMQ
jgi:hypothetical protein